MFLIMEDREYIIQLHYYIRIARSSIRFTVYLVVFSLYVRGILFEIIT